MAFKQKPKGELKSLLESKPKLSSDSLEGFQFSFRDFDTRDKYASTFRDWQKDGILSNALDILMGFTSSKKHMHECIDGTGFTKYGDWPSHSLFRKPEHVTPEACWARIHVNGKSIIVGHIVRNCFYIVFFDKTHAFYPTQNDPRVKKKDKIAG